VAPLQISTRRGAPLKTRKSGALRKLTM